MKNIFTEEMKTAQEKRFARWERLEKIRGGFGRASYNHLRDKAERKFLEKGIPYDDFFIHILDWGRYCSLRLRTIKNPIPPQIRQQVLNLANEYIHTYTDMQEPLILVRLCSEFPACSPLIIREIESTEKAFLVLKNVFEQIEDLHTEVTYWCQAEQVDDVVHFVPGICDVSGEPRIYVHIAECKEASSGQPARNQPEKVKALIRTLLAYESFEDSRYNKAK